MPHSWRPQPRGAGRYCEWSLYGWLLDPRSGPRTSAYSSVVEGHLGRKVVSRTKNLPATSRAGRRSPPVRIRIKGIQGGVASFESPGPADQVWRHQLKATLGTVSDAFVDMALHHLERAARIPGDGPSNISINGALALIAAVATRSASEAPWERQAAYTHIVAMVMMARIGGGHGGDRRLPALASAAAKLMRAHCMQVETYRRQRDGG